MLYPKTNPPTDVGVIIGRFQTHKLTDGHTDLIDSVMMSHKKVIILIGRNRDVLVTRKDPLDYMSRKLMIEQEYADITVLPLLDFPSDKDWSEGVDSQINSVIGNETVTIYGSRDSFIPHYAGNFPTVELEQHQEISATQVRDMVSREVRSSEDFRRGVIYAAFNSYPIVYPTVDCLVLADNNHKVALGRKKTDPEGVWRLPGGFVSPEDESTLQTVRREVGEELNYIETSDYKVVGGFKVNDWRYRDHKDRGIITTLYTAQYNWGQLKGTDDLSEARWFRLDEAAKVISDTHKDLLIHGIKSLPQTVISTEALNILNGILPKETA